MSTVCVFSLLKQDCQFKFLAMILDFQNILNSKFTMPWLDVLSTPVVIFWLLVAKLSLFLRSVSNDKGISFSSVKSEDGR